MRARWTILLALAVLMVAGGLYWAERRAGGGGRRARPGNRVINFAPGDVEAVDIQAGDIRLRAERTDGTWRMTVPLVADADPAAVMRLLDGFDLLERKTVISRAERNALGQGLEVFGLDRPYARWTFWTAADRQALWMGHASADGDRVYLFDETTEDIIAVSDEVLRLLPDTPDALRDRTLFTLDPFHIHRVELARPEGFVQFSRGPDGAWRIQQPLAARADPGAVRGLIALMVDARTTGFVRDGPGDDTRFGFDETGVAVALVADRPEAAKQRIEFGVESADRPGERYARLTGRTGVITVPESLYRNARIHLNELRDRRLVAFAPDDVREIDIRIGMERLTLQRGEIGWMLLRPVDAVADVSAVDTLLGTWAGARIERFYDDDPAIDDRIVESRVRRISFRIAAPGEEDERMVAFQVESPDSQGLIPVRREDADLRGAIHPLRLRGFTTDPAVYATARPLRLAREDVRGFTTRYAGREWTVTVGQNGAWTVIPDDWPLDPVEARNQLALLTDLPTIGIAGVGEEIDAVLGRENAHALIRIHLAETAGAGKTLTVGRRDDGEAFARVGGQGVVYRVDPVVADTLLRRPVTDADPEPDGG